MDDKRVTELCYKLATEDIVLKVEAAQEIVNSVTDKDMRHEFMSLLLKYNQAKDSVQQDGHFNDLIMHVKRQYALIYSQGFDLGKDFSDTLFKQAIRRAQIDKVEDNQDSSIEKEPETEKESE